RRPRATRPTAAKRAGASRVVRGHRVRYLASAPSPDLDSQHSQASAAFLRGDDVIVTFSRHWSTWSSSIGQICPVGVRNDRRAPACDYLLPPYSSGVTRGRALPTRGAAAVSGADSRACGPTVGTSTRVACPASLRR